MFTDTHAHLNDARFDDVDSIIAKCLKDNVSLIINAGYDLASSTLGQKIASRFDIVYYAAGVHPSEASGYNLDNLSLIEKLLNHNKCVAVGEVGLDYHYDGFDKDKQKALFLAQAELAKANNLPLIIHSRDCTQDMLNIISDNKTYFEKCVMHCFSGSAQTAKILTDLGIYISFAGPITFKNNKNAAQIVNVVPNSLILTETDCPYLAPEPYRGKTNYPYLVPYVLNALSMFKNIDTLQMCQIVRKNTLSLFNKIGDNFG